MKRKLILFILTFYIGIKVFGQKTSETWLDDLTIKSFSGGIPSVAGKTNAGGAAIKIGGKKFDRGVGVNSLSTLSFFLDGKAKSFTALAGVDDQTNQSFRFNFFVIGDRKILFESHNKKAGDAPEKINVNLVGVKRLGLLVTVSGERATSTYANWADAKLVMMDGHSPLTIPNDDEKYILTPVPLKTPKINSARIFGATAGNSILYSIAATGEKPMQFVATNLPKGLSIDPQTGIINGAVAERGEYKITIEAKNKLGSVIETLRLIIGDKIGLTPPIGWNGWNSWAREIDAEKVKASADAMVNMGLKDHGWTYINIDDAWQGQRGGKYNAIQPNEKFPSFKNMIDYIHSKGLKLGVYSTPWITSYAGFTGGSSNFANGQLTDSIVQDKRANRYIGKYRFEENDAKQMAEWGVDYLKYDWRLEVASAKRMSNALKHSGRDIFYSLSNSASFEFAKEWAAISNAWRTGPDIRDSWLSLYTSAFTLDKWAPYAGPGHWNDPDMMILGNVTTGTALHPTRLTPDEQYSHVSLFALLAAPLLIGCPIEQLDAFTLNLLTNDEIIAVDQDPLGKPGRLVADEDGVQIWVRSLEDGSYSIGLFNVDDFGKTPVSYFRWGDEKPKLFTFDFAKIGLQGKYQIRDQWRQKNLGEYSGSFKTTIPFHGVIMLRMSSK